MKKIVIALFAVFVFVPLLLLADDPCLRGTNFTSSSAVYTGRTHTCQLFITNDGTNDCTVQCYEATTNTATTEVATGLKCIAANGTTCLAPFNYLVKRLYCVVTTSGTCTAQITKYDDNR